MKTNETSLVLSRQTVINTYVPQKTRKQATRVSNARKESVKESIFKFLDGDTINSSADVDVDVNLFKESLVQSAQRENRKQLHAKNKNKNHTSPSRTKKKKTRGADRERQERVQAAKQRRSSSSRENLGIEQSSPQRESQKEIIEHPPEYSEDSNSSVGRQRRKELRAKLSGLSFERKKKHDEDKQSSDPTPILKMRKKESRLAKMQAVQILNQDDQVEPPTIETQSPQHTSLSSTPPTPHVTTGKTLKSLELPIERSKSIVHEKNDKAVERIKSLGSPPQRFKSIDYDEEAPHIVEDEKVDIRESLGPPPQRFKSIDCDENAPVLFDDKKINRQKSLGLPPQRFKSIDHEEGAPKTLKATGKDDKRTAARAELAGISFKLEENKKKRAASFKEDQHLPRSAKEESEGEGKEKIKEETPKEEPIGVKLSGKSFNLGGKAVSKMEHLPRQREPLDPVKKVSCPGNMADKPINRTSAQGSWPMLEPDGQLLSSTSDRLSSLSLDPMGSKLAGKSFKFPEKKLPTSAQPYMSSKDVGLASSESNDLSQEFSKDGNFFSFLNVLNDLQDLMGYSGHLSQKDLQLAPSTPIPSSNTSSLGNSTTKVKKRTRFQQMFQIKCSLFNFLGGETEDAEIHRSLLVSDYQLKAIDLDFILEHISLCQHESADIRWDLIESMIFPEAEEPKLGSVLGRSYHTKSSFDMPCSVDLSNDLTILGNSSVDSFDSETRREEYQAVILDLCEISEEDMADLSATERQMRKQILVELLQVTSEDDAHLCNLTLDDVSEIVFHVRICQETGTAIEWDMIQDIICPTGNDGAENRKRQSERTFQSQQYTALSQASAGKEDSEVENRMDTTDEEWNDSFFDNFDLKPAELKILLNHINHCTAIEIDSLLRWDLIGEILFPGDPLRQALLGSNQQGASSDPTKIVARTSNANELGESRHRAVMALSTHHERILSSRHDHDLDDERSFESCGTFG